MEETFGFIIVAIFAWVLVFALHVAILRWLLRLNTILWTLCDIRDELKEIRQATRAGAEPVL